MLYLTFNLWRTGSYKYSLETDMTCPHEEQEWCTSFTLLELENGLTWMMAETRCRGRTVGRQMSVADNPGWTDDFKDRVTNDLVSLPPPRPSGSELSISETLRQLDGDLLLLLHHPLGLFLHLLPLLLHGAFFSLSHLLLSADKRTKAKPCHCGVHQWKLGQLGVGKTKSCALLLCANTAAYAAPCWSVWGSTRLPPTGFKRITSFFLLVR